jgi:N-acetylneuraminic acid mutarotase
MPRHPYFAAALTCGVLLFAGCGEDTPTEPSIATDPGLTRPSLATTSNSWASIAPMPGLFGSKTSIGVVPSSSGPSIAYVFGGTTEQGGSGALTRAYNVATNTWSTKSSEVPTFDMNGVGNIGGKLYFTGGFPEHGSPASVATTWQYDPATDKLTQKADMPLHTAQGVTGVIGDKLYVLPGYCYAIGVVRPGFCVESDLNRKFFRYNPATNTWVSKATAPHYHRNGVGGVINNKFYVAGGLNGQLAPSTNLDVYDLATNTWKMLARVPSALSFVSGAVVQGKLFVVGRNSSGAIRHYAYNPATNTWSTRTAPAGYGRPAAQVFLNGTARMLVLPNQIYTP